MSDSTSLHPAPPIPGPIYSDLANDPDLAELVEVYVDETQDRIQELLASFEQAEWGHLGSLAHQIKGAAGSYGFHAVTEPAGQLESVCRQAGTSEDVLPSLDRLVDLLSRLEATAEDVESQG